jgi:hypothetical protein
MLLVKLILERRQITNELHGEGKVFEKLTVAQLVKEFPTFYVTWRVITMFTGVFY